MLTAVLVSQVSFKLVQNREWKKTNDHGPQMLVCIAFFFAYKLKMKWKYLQNRMSLVAAINTGVPNGVNEDFLS